MASHAAIAVSDAGDNPIVAAPGVGKFIRVHGYLLTAAADVSVDWRSGVDAEATSLTGAMGVPKSGAVSMRPEMRSNTRANTGKARRISAKGMGIGFRRQPQNHVHHGVLLNMSRAYSSIRSAIQGIKNAAATAMAAIFGTKVSDCS